MDIEDTITKQYLKSGSIWAILRLKQSIGVFGLRSASVRADHVPPAHSAPRGSRQISEPTSLALRST